jgi:TldD protein
MNGTLETARNRLLVPVGLDETRLNQTLDHVLGHRVDAADLYFQSSRRESWMLEDGQVREGSHGIEQGVGVRAMSGERTGFAYSDELHADALMTAADAARSIGNAGGDGAVAAWSRREPVPLYVGTDPLDSLPDDEKVAWLQRLDRAARAADPAVSEVIVSLAAVHDTVLVVGSDGTFAADQRPLVRLSISVIAERAGRRERGSAGGGGRYDYRQLLDSGLAGRFVEQAVREALINLDADDAPAGTMTVVLGPGWPGILLHEAIGHGLEGDFNRKGTSAFSGRVGQSVASPLCTVVDDGTLPARRGSLTVDDEGTPTQCTTLIENGVLRGFMQDKLNARLSGREVTGNGRRESFAHLPMPRMTNTYMLPGESDPQEIVASVKRGLYAANFGGGQVDITSGKFVFSASEAWLIEDGRLTRPVRGATLIGNGPDVLTRVSMVGNDLELDSGVGTCGKDGQSVPVGVGQPTLRIDGLTVGGTR